MSISSLFVLTIISVGDVEPVFEIFHYSSESDDMYMLLLVTHYLRVHVNSKSYLQATHIEIQV